MMAAVGLAFVLLIANREIARRHADGRALHPVRDRPDPGDAAAASAMLNVAGPMQQGIAAGASVFQVLDAPPSRRVARGR